MALAEARNLSPLGVEPNRLSLFPPPPSNGIVVSSPEALAPSMSSDPVREEPVEGLHLAKCQKGDPLNGPPVSHPGTAAAEGGTIHRIPVPHTHKGGTSQIGGRGTLEPGGGGNERERGKEGESPPSLSPPSDSPDVLKLRMEAEELV